MKSLDRQDGGPAATEVDPRDAKELSPDENADLCAGCVKCCTYITIEIDAPRAAWEYDQWIWALHHRNIQLYLERPERWFIHVDAVCEQLNDQGRCSIYGRHPVLCRDYDPRSCERRLPLADIVAWFHDASELEAWMRLKRPAHWERLTKYRKDQPSGDPVAPGHRVARGLLAITGLSGAPLDVRGGDDSRSRGRARDSNGNGAHRAKPVPATVRRESPSGARPTRRRKRAVLSAG
jgi:uncharacterized protein